MVSRLESPANDSDALVARIVKQAEGIEHLSEAIDQILEMIGLTLQFKRKNLKESAGLPPIGTVGHGKSALTGRLDHLPFEPGTRRTGFIESLPLSDGDGDPFSAMTVFLKNRKLEDEEEKPAPGWGPDPTGGYSLKS